ncbi:MAG: dihydroorotate dehydrogenase electron transfer subunit, partial [Fusobacteriaceae bacterium]|nr:dihydroorotate dehydrogenase electron transfer subunit [Fusobacteriaceae bacterium]
MLLEDFKVLENKRVNGNYFLMKLSSQNLAEKCKAGQFFMLKMKNEITILRRPISIHNVDKQNGVIEFYYEVKGRGTIEMADKQEGDLINLQGPL